MFDLRFFLNAALFGFGLAMDAFSVSLANGIREPEMPRRRAAAIAGIFAAFQTLTPLAGWGLVRAASALFSVFRGFLPWGSLALLAMIGGRMIKNGLRGKAAGESPAAGAGALLLQGAATSVDALSVGLTSAGMPASSAAVQALVIGCVTFCLCFAGAALGKRCGAHLAEKGEILGGAILIGIGLEIFFKGVFR